MPLPPSLALDENGKNNDEREARGDQCGISGSRIGGGGETEKKHGEFVERMVARGYTERQVRRLVEWYMRVKQAG